MFETKSFKAGNTLFQVAKRSVSRCENRLFQALKLFLKLLATGEEMVKLLLFTRKLLIHRRDREKVKEEIERLKINTQ